MSRKPTEGPTTEQQRLLTNVRKALTEGPGQYDQGTYGIGAITCRAPACIAGHLVASDPVLLWELRQRFGDRPMPPPAESPHVIGEAIHAIATRALGLEKGPRMFDSVWPSEWLGGEQPTEGQREGRTTFIPGATDAVKVIDRILDGQVPDALEPMRQRQRPN